MLVELYRRRIYSVLGTILAIYYCVWYCKGSCSLYTDASMSLVDLSSLFTDNAAIISAIFGGAGVKLMDKLLSNRGENFGEATALRTELRVELTALHTEIASKRSEADVWRAKYWEQIEENIKLKVRIESLQSDLDKIKLLLGIDMDGSPDVAS